jgi:GTPase involved in cell partitioning and DNA repair
VSDDLEFLYSSAEDGSIFVSSISAVSNDTILELKNFYYFDMNNVLPKKIHFSSDQIIYITDSIYQNKVDSLKKKKSAIQGMISEFQSRKEKINQNNTTDLENQRTKLTELLDQKIKEVKDKETEKEKETKKLKDDREIQFKKLKDELAEMKKKI